MRLRLAPRATAPLHLGNTRMALLAWLHARRHGGRVVLRLDDTEERATPETLAALRADLEWLGLDWDGVQLRSAEADLHAEAIGRLQASGRLYPCFENEEELNSKRDRRQRRGEPAIYDRAMLHLTPAQRAAAEAGGKRPHWRFLLSGNAAVWNDAVLGRQAVKLSATSDPVLVRADGTPVPLLADVVDDIGLGVTDVVFGEDHLSATGVQMEVRGALGARPLTLAHVPLLLGPDGGALKRAASLTLRSLRADGVEPAALVALLARSAGTEAPEPVAAPVLSRRFDLRRVSRKPSRFEPPALLRLNRAALRELPFEAVQDRLPPAATASFWLAVRGGLDLLREARGWWDVVGGTIVPPLIEGETAFLSQARALLPPEPWDADTWHGWTAALSAETGRSGSALADPLRLALTGEDHGPDLQPLLPLIGRSRAAERLRLAAA